MANKFKMPYIALGVRNDLENLLSCFTETQSVRYEEFAKVWREMKMPLIFYGRQDIRELRQFTEELFSIALNYALPPFSFQVRTGGLYILYGLFQKQPCVPKIKFRLTSGQWVQLMELVAEAKKQSHLDAVYVFLKLRYQHAFHFCATTKPLYPRNQGTKESDFKRDLEEEEIAAHNLLSELFESNNIDHLADVHDQYHRLKCAMSGPEATKPDADIDMIHSNLVQYITKTVAVFEEFKKTGKKPKRRRRDSGATSESDGDSDTEDRTYRPRKSQGTIRSEIKERAFASKPESTRGRRHRRGKAPTDTPKVKSEKTSRKKKPNHSESTEDTAGTADTADTADEGGRTDAALPSMPTSFEQQLAEADQVLAEMTGSKKRGKKPSAKKAQEQTGHTPEAPRKRGRPPKNRGTPAETPKTPDPSPSPAGRKKAGKKSEASPDLNLKKEKKEKKTTKASSQSIAESADKNTGEGKGQKKQGRRASTRPGQQEDESPHKRKQESPRKRQRRSKDNTD